MAIGTETFSFALILAGVKGETSAIEDALFESGCDDALLGRRDGVYFLDFDREAESFLEAIRTAIRDVQQAKIGASVVRIEPDDFVTAAEIARRVSQSRESIWKYIRGERGPGGFPPPASNATKHSPLWKWSEVAGWLKEAGLVEPAVAEQAQAIAAVNHILEARRQIGLQPRFKRLWRELQNKAADTEPGSRKKNDRGRKSAAALASLIARMEKRPAHGGGKRFTRDELHERKKV